MRKYIKNSTLQGVKKIVCVILAMFLILTFCGCSFVGDWIGSCIGEMFEEAPGFTYGDFECGYVSKASSIRRTSKKYAVGINIYGLVEEAQEKETIIIPESIDGLPVIAIGMGGLGWELSLRKYGAKYNKIYLPETIKYIQTNYDVGWGVKVFFLNMPQYIGYWEDLYILEKDYAEYEKYFQEKDRIGALSRIHIANLTYLVDEEVYWIDDYDEGEKIVFPVEPIKIGYVFAGWYKEIECITEWQEDTDTYSKIEEKQTVKLYAKWIEDS